MRNEGAQCVPRRRKYADLKSEGSCAARHLPVRYNAVRLWPFVRHPQFVGGLGRLPAISMTEYDPKTDRQTQFAFTLTFPVLLVAFVFMIRSHVNPLWYVLCFVLFMPILFITFILLSGVLTLLFWLWNLFAHLFPNASARILKWTDVAAELFTTISAVRVPFAFWLVGGVTSLTIGSCYVCSTLLKSHRDAPSRELSPEESAIDSLRRACVEKLVGAEEHCLEYSRRANDFHSLPLSGAGTSSFKSKLADLLESGATCTTGVEEALQHYVKYMKAIAAESKRLRGVIAEMAEEEKNAASTDVKASYKDLEKQATQVADAWDKDHDSAETLEKRREVLWKHFENIRSRNQLLENTARVSQVAHMPEPLEAAVIESILDKIDKLESGLTDVRPVLSELAAFLTDSALEPDER